MNNHNVGSFVRQWYDTTCPKCLHYMGNYAQKKKGITPKVQKIIKQYVAIPLEINMEKLRAYWKDR